MANDVFISIGVLVSFCISIFTGSIHADTIVAMLISVWIIKTAIGIFIDANNELIDGNNDKESYRAIIDAVNSVDGAYTPHRARIRSIAGFWDIDFDIAVDPGCTVIEAHTIATQVQVEREIKNRLENAYDIMIHVEPQDDNGTEAGQSSEGYNTLKS